MPKKRQGPLYQRVREILESARVGVARSVNTTQVVANWLIGREIVEEEQNGKHRADYGKQVIEELSQRLLSDYGSGYSVQNLWLIRQFYLNYPRLLSPAKIPHALRGESSSHNKLADTGILYAPRRESWKPGQLNPNFSWTHYRILLRVDKPQAQAFYEIEAIKITGPHGSWNDRKTACCTSGWL